jgi:membrane-associated protein
MNYRRFILYNIVGGIGWVCSMILAGYWLGRSIPHIDLYVHKIILVIIFLSIVPIACQIWAEQRSLKLKNG